MRSVFRIETESQTGAFISGLVGKYAAAAKPLPEEHPMRMPCPDIDGSVMADWNARIHAEIDREDGKPSFDRAGSWEIRRHWHFAFPSVAKLLHWFADENARHTLHHEHHARFRELEIPSFACVVSPHQVIFDRRQVIAQHELCPRTLKRIAENCRQGVEEPSFAC